MVETASKELKKREKDEEMRTLYRIAQQIKAGTLPSSYSKKGTELADKYDGEVLEKLAWGGY